MENEKDQELWRLAKKRVSFKRHLATYLIVNTFFWCIWMMDEERHEQSIPWPIWSMLGWGIGLAFEYIGAYVTPKNNAIEKEYQKLKDEDNSQ